MRANIVLSDKLDEIIDKIFPLVLIHSSIRGEFKDQKTTKKFLSYRNILAPYHFINLKKIKSHLKKLYIYILFVQRMVKPFESL